MRKCSVESDKLSLSFSYNLELVNSIKELPSYCRRYNPREKKWLVNLDVSNSKYVAHELHNLLVDYSFTITNDARALINEHYPISEEIQEDENALEDSYAEDADIEVDFITLELRPFQKAGVKYLYEHKKAFLADEMGLGKTGQAIATIQHAHAHPCLVVTPVSLQRNWANEIFKWTDCWASYSLTPNAQSNFNIIPYTQVKKYMNELDKIPFKSMICDESHYLKNAKAQRTKLIKKLSKRIERVYLLSGTPIVNRPAELISQLDILNMMNELGGWQYFVKEYCNAYRDRFGLNISGSKNLKTLNREMRKRCYIRRQKKDVLKELPDKQRVRISVDIEDWKEYNKAEQVVLSKIESMAEDYENNGYNLCLAIDQADSLQEAKSLVEDDIFCETTLSQTNKASSYDKLKDIVAKYYMNKSDNVSNAQALMLLNELKKSCAEQKMKSVIEWVKDFLESGEKLILFADHINIQKSLFAELHEFNPCAVFGEMDGEERQKNVDMFQTNPDKKVIVCSLQAAGVGLTMTAAQKVSARGH